MLDIYEVRISPMRVNNPPTDITNLGPYLSTITPTTRAVMDDTHQLTVKPKASWALDQWRSSRRVGKNMVKENLEELESNPIELEAITIHHP
jgi:hypothetical protein